MSAHLTVVLWSVLLSLYGTAIVIAFLILLKAGYFKPCFACLGDWSYVLCYPFVNRTANRDEELAMD